MEFVRITWIFASAARALTGILPALAAVVMLAGFPGPSARAAETFHLCLFDLEAEEKSLPEIRAYAERLSRASPGTKFVVHAAGLAPDRNDMRNAMDDFQDSARLRFEAMVRRNERCDGLVLSGRYGAGFSGKLADDALTLNFLEKLACRPELRDWFAKVRVTWLLGARTLANGAIEAEPEARDRNAYASLQEDMKARAPRGETRHLPGAAILHDQHTQAGYYPVYR